MPCQSFGLPVSSSAAPSHVSSSSNRAAADAPGRSVSTKRSDSFEDPLPRFVRYAAFRSEASPTPLRSLLGATRPLDASSSLTELTLVRPAICWQALPVGDEWATREGVHIDLTFTAMRRPRHGHRVVASAQSKGPCLDHRRALAREDHRHWSRVRECDGSYRSYHRHLPRR